MKWLFICGLPMSGATEIKNIINLDNITYNKAIDLVINGNINRCISKDKNKHYRYWVKD